MGHHLFVLDEARLAVEDFDLELIRHLLLRASRELGLAEVERSISGWEYQGPGVWIGIDEKTMFNRPELFDRAAEITARFGDEIPVRYLKEELRLDRILLIHAQQTRPLIEKLQQLKDFFSLAGR